MDIRKECETNIEGLKFTGFNESKKKYIMTMRIVNDKLIIDSYSESDINNAYYKTEKNFNELIQNKFLTIYENIFEIFTALTSFILDKESHKEYSKIKEEEKYITLSIPLNLGKYKEFNIKLNESKITPELRIIKLEQTLKEQQNEINKLKEKTLELERQNII